MNGFEIHQLIKERFKRYDRLDLLRRYEHAGDGAATGTEGNGMVSQFLNGLKTSDPSGYKLINDLVEQWNKLH